MSEIVSISEIVLTIKFQLEYYQSISSLEKLYVEKFLF